MPYTDFFIVFFVGILSAIVSSILIYQFIRIKDLEEQLNTHIYDDNTIDEFDDDLTISEKINEIYKEINVIQDIILINEKLKVIEENTKAEHQLNDRCIRLENQIIEQNQKLQEQIKALYEQINKSQNDDISS